MLYVFITARVRSTREGNVLTRVCPSTNLSVHRGGTYPIMLCNISQNAMRQQRGGGVPRPPLGGRGGTRVRYPPGGGGYPGPGTPPGGTQVQAPRGVPGPPPPGGYPDPPGGGTRVRYPPGGVPRSGHPGGVYPDPPGVPRSGHPQGGCTQTPLGGYPGPGTPLGGYPGQVPPGGVPG